MQINPPFGYSEIVPLYKNQKVRLPAPGALPEFCRKVNAVPISYSEFAVACRDYPLAFITTDQSKTFLPVAVLGVTGGENLFLRDGQWDGSVERVRSVHFDNRAEVTLAEPGFRDVAR